VIRALRIALVVAFAAALLAVPAQAQASSVSVFAPATYSSAALDEQIRFSWFPNNGQDFYRVVFSQYRSFGWENSPYRTPETVLNFTYTSPRELGLTPGTWYWRVCYGWYDNPGVCYPDADIRMLDVEAPPSAPAPRPTRSPVAPPTQSPAPTRPDVKVYTATAISATKKLIRQTYRVRPFRLRCDRASSSMVTCRTRFRYHGHSKKRAVDVWSDGDTIYYSFRK
jgi:hypothetical protein